MRSANLAVRLVLELAALVGLAYVGWEVASTLTGRLLLAVLGPALFAGVWGVLISPKAPRRLRDPLRLAVEVVLFALVAGGLTIAGVPSLALVFGIAAGAHLVLMVRWGQRGM